MNINNFPISKKYVALVCIILTVVILSATAYFIIKSHISKSAELTQISEKTSLPAPSENLQETNIIPAWYAPQELRVTTVTYSSTATGMSYSPTQNQRITKLSANTNAPTTSSSDTSESVNKSTCENIVADVPSNSSLFCGANAQCFDLCIMNSEQHKHCSSMYFDIMKKEVICPMHIIRNTMKLSEDAGILMDVITENNNYYIYTVEASRKSYIMNAQTLEYKELPMSLYAHYMSFASSDFHYIMLLKNKQYMNLGEIYLIDTQNSEYKIISEEYNPKDIRFSNNNAFACFTTMEGESLPADRRCSKWILYNIQTGKYMSVIGDLIRFYNNDTIALINTVNGYKLFDTITGQLSETNTVFSGADVYITNEGFPTTDQNYRYTNIVNRIDITNSKTETITKQEVDAYCKSSDEKYLYTYTLGDASIKCICIETLESFLIPVSGDFISQSQGELEKGKRVLFDISVSKDMNELLLCYQSIVVSDGTKHPPMENQGTNPPAITEEARWDIREHSAQETIDEFDCFLLSTFEPPVKSSSSYSANEINKTEDLAEMLGIFISQDFSPINDYTEYIGYIDNELYFELTSYDNEIRPYCPTIKVERTVKGDYYIYIQTLSVYSYISNDDFNRLMDLYNKLVTRVQ